MTTMYGTTEERAERSAERLHQMDLADAFAAMVETAPDRMEGLRSYLLGFFGGRPLPLTPEQILRADGINR